ncbi:MAG: NAD(P)-dependent alcohol dehydrogenase [Ilumatobacteraceae bacterium]
MRALQYRTIGSRPELVEVPDPEPGPGQVLLRVTAAGVCHSDEHVMSMPAEAYTFGLPLTLGHEGAGEVIALGDGATGVEVGEQVLVYGPWGCGVCWQCSRGWENYCPRAAALGIAPPGLGAPGAMADLMVVDSPRHLVPIGDLDPVAAVPLTDAGLTPYHAIMRSIHKIRPGGWAVVIGAGGLGHMAVQLLKVLAGVRVVAVDLDEHKLEHTLTVGADAVVKSDANAGVEIGRVVGAEGATLVLDVVGIQPTMDLAVSVAGIGADVAIVGIGDFTAAAHVGFGHQAHEVSVCSVYWGGRHELIELVDMARAGLIEVTTETFPLADGTEAYRRMHEGTLIGRAVVVP